MSARSAQLAKNISVVADQPAVLLPAGGRCVIVSKAATYPTTCQVQFQVQDGSTWVNIGSNITADAVSTALDLPAGQYRLHMTGGTAAAVNVDLVSVPYY